MADQHNHQHNRPPQQHQPPPKPPTIVGDEPAPFSVPDTVDKRFRELFVENLFDVVEGSKRLIEAKKALHNFVDDLSAADKKKLLAVVTPLTKRVRDIVQSLASETPALIVILQQGDSE